MKKVTTLSLTVILGVFLMVMPAVASNCHVEAGSKVGKTEAKAAEKTAETTKTEKVEEADATAAESAVKTAEGEKVEEADKAAKADDGLTLVKFNVKGMTCGGCEAHVSKTLKACDGVTEVVEVSHKDNLAVVIYDPNKIETDKLVSSITKLGYEAEVQPAVATTTKEAVKEEEKKVTKDM